MNDSKGANRRIAESLPVGDRLPRRRSASRAAALLAGIGISVAVADHEGLPFTETFDDAHLSDASTSADWGGSTPGFLRLPAGEPLTGPFNPSASGENVGDSEHTTRALVLADMNGDGLLDLVEGAEGTNGVYLNEGGSFPIRLPIAPDTDNTRGIAVGDVDGDGDLDVVAGNFNGRPRLYLNAGDGVQYTASDISSDAWKVDSIALADLNGDNHLDVVVAVHWDTVRRLYLNTGDPAAPFGAEGVEGQPVGSAPRFSQDVLVGDVDNDGDADLVMINELYPNRLYINDGGGTFTETTIGQEADNSQAGALGDLDGDGYLDLVVGNYPQNAMNRIYLNSGDPSAPFSSTTPAVDFPELTSYVHGVTLGDVDNDGDLDILLSMAGENAPEPNKTRFTNRLYLNDGTGSFAASDVGADMDITNTSVIGDVDGDGQPDIIAGNEARTDTNGAFGAMNRLYRNVGTPSGGAPVTQLFAHATSVRVDAETAPIAAVSLDAAFDPLGLHNEAEFWVSSNGGINWLQVSPGGPPVVFPEGIRGSDLRWRAVLSSLSPAAEAAPALAIDSVTISSDAPTFTSMPVTEAAVDAEYVYEVSATDPDAGDALTLEALTAPAWLSLTDNGDGTGTLSGTPAVEDIGAHGVVLQVSDSSGTATRQTFSVTVAGAGEAPSFTSTPVTSAPVDAEYAYSITASDPEGEALVLSALTLPTWLTFTDNGDGTGSLIGTPEAEHVGDHPIELQAQDASGLTAAQTFTVTVTEAGGENGPPSFASTPGEEATEDSEYSYEIEVTDPDAGDTLEITAMTLPAWLTFTDNGDGTASLSGTPAAADVGDHDVVLQAADAAGATVEQSFTVTVEAASPPPSNPNPPSNPPTSGSSGGGGGSAGAGELLGLAALALLIGRRRRRGSP